MTEERGPTPIDPNALYTLREARQLLRISDATARRWVKEGRLRARKIGRDYRVRGQAMLETTNELGGPQEAKILRPGSKLLQLMGIGDSGLTDISENKHKYLAEIYYEKSHPKPKS